MIFVRSLPKHEPLFFWREVSWSRKYELPAALDIAGLNITLNYCFRLLSTLNLLTKDLLTSEKSISHCLCGMYFVMHMFVVAMGTQIEEKLKLRLLSMIFAVT